MEIAPFFAEYGLLLVFGVVLVEQLGMPIPALPVLMFAGAAAIDDPLYGVTAVAVAILACMIGMPSSEKATQPASRMSAAGSFG